MRPAGPPKLAEGGTDATTQLHAFGAAVLGTLSVDAGPEPLLRQQFVLRNCTSRIGRGADCEVLIADPRISREHARLIPEGLGFFIEHRSHTNPTFVNGELLTERRRLQHGDHILLAEDILLRLDAPHLAAEPRRRVHPGSLREAMEARAELETRIRDRFMRDGSFVDVDVVDSYGLKQNASPDQIVISFERFRALVEAAISEHQGRILNSNGDEVMAYFEDAEASLEAGRAILAALPAFNRDSNLLGRDFAVRIGIDTGRCAVDLDRGVAYSPILDGAGHLQKAAPPGGVLMSQATRAALSKPHPELLEQREVGKQRALAWLSPPSASSAEA